MGDKTIIIMILLWHMYDAERQSEMSDRPSEKNTLPWVFSAASLEIVALVLVYHGVINGYAICNFVTKRSTFLPISPEFRDFTRPVQYRGWSYQTFFCHFPDYNENGTGRTQEEGEWLSPDSIYFLSRALHKRKKEENNIFHILIGF